MTNQESQFNLLNGTFTATESKEILGRLFADKISFNSLKNFSHEERFGIPDTHAVQRIPELKKTLEDILLFLGQNGGTQRFELYADIRIKVVRI